MGLHVRVPRVCLPRSEAHISDDGHQSTVSKCRLDICSTVTRRKASVKTHPSPNETALFAIILAMRSFGTSSFFVGFTIKK